MSAHRKADTDDGGGDGLLLVHGEALDAFGSRVHAVRDDQWDAPTPCTEWSVRDLVNHLTAEQLWVPRLVRDGATIAEVGDTFDGDVLGEDPAAAWDRAALAAVAAFSEPGALDREVELSYGKSGAAAYCEQMMADAVVHAWDLARAIGASEELPAGPVASALRAIEPLAPGLSATGLFDEAIEPPAGADDLTRLLCLVGRRP